jgi:tryptophan-rich sensory protein
MNSAASASPDTKWYKSLNQSPLTPPSWVFPIAWTILYALIIASGVVFLSATTSISSGVRSTGFFYYCAAWVLNLSWSQIFFRFQRPDLSFVVILGMLAFIALNIRAFYESDPEGVIDASGCDALNSAHVSFFSGIAGRDVLAAFDFARLSFVSFSASKFSARLSALST